MIIFKDYDTTSMIMGEDCFVEDFGIIYPIRIKDYKEFEKHSKYLSFGKKHLKLPKEVSLLEGIIYCFAMSNGGNENEVEEVEILKVIDDLSKLFSLILRKPIYYDGTIFTDEERLISINNKNYNLLRTIVMKMNLLREPKIYDRDIDRLWEEKAMMAKQKRQANLELGELMIVVSQDLKKPLSEIKEMSILEFYTYYYRIQHIYEFESTRLFATVSDKIKPEQPIKEMIKELYKDPYADLNVKGDFMGIFE